MKKKLYRDESDKYVGGVLSGFAKYFDQDPTIWRLVFLVFLIITGFMPGVLIYIVAWFLIPSKPPSSFSESSTIIHEHD